MGARADLYFDITRKQRWIVFFLFSIACALLGVAISAIILEEMPDEIVNVINSTKITSGVFILLFINGHVVGDRLLIIKKTRNESGEILPHKSGFLVVLWIIATAVLSKYIGELLIIYTIFSERNVILSAAAVTGCAAAIFSLAVYKVIVYCRKNIHA